MLGFFAYLQATLGPLMPFLRDELRLNYTVAGLHFSGFAFGMMLAGTSGERVAGWLGRKYLFWMSGLGMSLAGLLLTLGQSHWVTITSAFLMGFLGTFLAVMVQALLSDEQGDKRGIALTEANISASLFSLVAPLAIGFSPRIGLDWRLALWLGVFIWVIVYALRFRTPIPKRKHVSTVDAKHTQTAKTSLPQSFTLYRIIIFIGVSVEWCMIFWASDFLITVAELQPDFAATVMSIFFGAMLIGRTVGSMTLRRVATMPLLLMMVMLIVIGFPLFWLVDNVTLRIMGLFIIGFGMANLFPLGLAAASDAGSGDVDRASARIAQAAGLAILIAPQILAMLSDEWGIFRAYAILPFLLSVLIIMILFTIYTERSISL